MASSGSSLEPVDGRGGLVSALEDGGRFCVKLDAIFFNHMREGKIHLQVYAGCQTQI